MKTEYTYWIYYHDNEIYAYTDNKSYAEQFEDFRDMKKFKRVKKELSKEEVNYLAKEYQCLYLKEYSFDVYDKENEDNYPFEIVITSMEEINVNNNTMQVRVNLSTDTFDLNPKYFNKDIQKALYIIGYLTIYEENQLPFQNDSLENRIVPVPDQLSIFISLYGWSIKDF